MVTVAGAGGIGKTRVGEAVAHRLLAGRADGVWWIDLAPVNDAAMVGATVARALGLDPGGARSQTHLVASALRATAAFSSSTTASTCSTRWPSCRLR